MCRYVNNKNFRSFVYYECIFSSNASRRMPAFIRSYDLSTVYCRNEGVRRSSVYESFGRRLRNHGWQRIQGSLWSKENASEMQVFAEINVVANAIELRFFNNQPGIFRRLELHEFIHQTFIRH